MSGFQTGEKWLVGESTLAGRPNGIAPGVLADLSANPAANEWVGGIHQGRVSLTEGALMRSEVATFLSAAAARELQLLVGQVPASGEEWVLVSRAEAERRVGTGGAGALVGKVIHIAAKPRVVVGILPRAFDFPRLAVSHFVLAYPENGTGRGPGQGFLLAKPKEGVATERAMAELEQRMARIRTEHHEDSKTYLKMGTAVEFAWEMAQPGLAIGGLLVGLLGAAALVYVALLVHGLIERGAEQRKIMAMLGAGVGAAHGSLFVALGLLLGLGGGLGAMLAEGALYWARASAPWTIAWPERGVIWAASGAATLFLALAAFALTVALSGMFRGLLTVRATRGASIAGPRLTRRWGWTSRVAVFAMVSAAVCFALCLLPLERKIRDFLTEPKGFAQANLLLVTATEKASGLTQEQVLAEWRQAGRALAQDARVDCIALTDKLPLTTVLFPYNTYRREGERDRAVELQGRHVDGAYRRCMGIRLLEGEDLPLAGGGASGFTPVLLSETAARRIFPGEKAVGQTLLSQYRSRGTLRVVGVVEDTRQLGVDRKDRENLFLPLDFAYPNAIVMRTKVPLGVREAEQLLSNPARAEAGYLRYQVDTVESLERKQLRKELFHQSLLRTLAGALLVLGMIGLGAALSAQVRARTKELAIRLAVGGSYGRIVGQLAGQFAVPVVAGGLAGVGLAKYLEVWLEGYVGGLNFAWQSDSWLLVMGMALCLAGAMAPACWRAWRLDAAQLLRWE
ncbi:MAG: FtsX-like permease family protein [Bryobacter sp.]|nr:FtsX-like permease family protein [Bryobacter sp.]